MDVLFVILATFASLAVLFLLGKLMGRKQVSQMTMFDYIIGISIGSIAAEMATELESPWRPLLAMVLYGVTAFLISVLTSKSLKARKKISGKPLILLDNGVLYRDSLQQAKMDLDDFLTACRVAGYFDLNQIQTALLEHNGNLSVLPAAAYRPVTPSDVQLRPKQETLMTPVIMDGEVLTENLQSLGLDERWLQRALEQQKQKRAADIFLAFCDREKQLTLYPMQRRSA